MGKPGPGLASLSRGIASRYPGYHQSRTTPSAPSPKYFGGLYYSKISLNFFFVLLKIKSYA